MSYKAALGVATLIGRAHAWNVNLKAWFIAFSLACARSLASVGWEWAVCWQSADARGLGNKLCRVVEITARHMCVG
jgi:hypothetical protein